MRKRETEVRGGNINWGLMVQVKAQLGNRWPQINFLFLPIESDRADNDPSPPTNPLKAGRGLYRCLDFDLDLQVLTLIPTHHSNTPIKHKSNETDKAIQNTGIHLSISPQTIYLP